MTVFNIHEAKTHFSKLLERVLNGEEVVIAKAGKHAHSAIRGGRSFPARSGY
jgi:hypothetical protein